MQSKQSNPFYEATRATSRTNLGKRSQDRTWSESPSKIKRSNTCSSIHSASLQLTKQWQQPENKKTPSLTLVFLSEEMASPLSMENLELWLTRELIESLELQDDLSIFFSAPRRPLITPSYLGELDLVLHDARFRHNINFEKKGFFQPSYRGDLARIKSTHEQQYWEAMSIEFAIYARCRRLLSTSYQNPVWSPNATKVPGISILWRFPQMLSDLSDLVCMVVPKSMWDLVREHFDVPLIMQKLSRGIFKLNTLIEWLGMLLQRSCAPRRDIQIRAAVTATAKALSNDDLKGMVLSLKRFFYIIETMKLDSVNYCINHRKTAIIDTTVTELQTYFQQEIESQRFSTTETQEWFQSLVDSISQSSYDSIDLQDVLTEGIIDMVKSSDSIHPSTFFFDADRLHCLQTHFRYILHKEIVRRTLAHFANRSRCEHRGSSTMSSQHLLSRVDAMVEPTDLASNWSTIASTIALEIIRCLPEFNHPTALPTAEILEEVETFLKNTEREDSELHTAAERYLQENLRSIVAREMKIKIAQASMIQQEELEVIAKKIAHLSILHWRIWGPTLYQQLFAKHKVCKQDNVPKVAELGPRGSCTSGLYTNSNRSILASASPMDNRLI